MTNSITLNKTTSLSILTLTLLFFCIPNKAAQHPEKQDIQREIKEFDARVHAKIREKFLTEEQRRDLDTQLIEAAKVGTTKSIYELSMTGATANAFDRDDMTALLWTALHDHIEIAKALVHVRADVTIQNKRGQTALTTAVGAGSTKMVDFLLANGATIKNSPLVVLAVENDDIAMTGLLLDKKADINVRDHDDRFALLVSVWRDNSEMATLLLGRKARVDQRCKKTSETAMSNAIRKGNLEMAQLLLSHKAKIDPITNNTTYLMQAAKNGDISMAELLLTHKAAVNIQDQNGRTALMAIEDNTEMAELLLKYKADCNIQDNHGATALNIARRDGHTAVVALLTKYATEQQEPTVVASTPCSSSPSTPLSISPADTPRISPSTSPTTLPSSTTPSSPSPAQK